jgi:hypothetical protein
VVYGVGGLALAVVVLVGLGLAGVIGPPKPSPEAIASSVGRDPTRMDVLFARPVGVAYGRELHWQSNGSRCGPASLVNVFRSWGEDIRDEAAILDGTGKCWSGICVMGLTLDELADVARAHGTREVTVLRDLDLETFREHLRLANDPSRRYVVNFSRAPIFGQGPGHHSPIGGFLAEEDLVLVLDVNEQYRPWLVEAERLFAAMDTLDGDAKRGLLLLQ